MGSLKKILKKTILKNLPIFIFQDVAIKMQKDLSYENSTYSQEGEDRILLRFFENRSDGFFIDVGAHHPVRFSNTFLFYLKGWRGINIDAMPGSMDLFKQIRPEDQNLEIAVSDKQQLLTYYIFNESALNTFSKAEAKRKDGLRNYKVINEIDLPTSTLSDVLDKFLPSNTTIDFLTIDVEGLDFQVLKSNNWEKYQPSMILIESLRDSIDNVNENPIYIYLIGLGYQFVAKTLNTMFFKKSNE